MHNGCGGCAHPRRFTRTTHAVCLLSCRRRIHLRRVHYAHVTCSIGSEQNGYRPVVIGQNDIDFDEQEFYTESCSAFDRMADYVIIAAKCLYSEIRRCCFHIILRTSRNQIRDNYMQLPYCLAFCNQFT